LKDLPARKDIKGGNRNRKGNKKHIC
jgi:hypothetical protein